MASYGNIKVMGDSACPECRKAGRDATGNHLVHYFNEENNDEWVKCGRCGLYDPINVNNKAEYDSLRKERVELSPEDLKQVLEEALELPIKEFRSRGLSLATCERFEFRAGLSAEDGETVISHFYPQQRGGELVGFRVRGLDPKSFYGIGNGTECDLGGMAQAQRGDVYTGKLFLFEDELSAASGFQVLVANSKTTYKPACVWLPYGAGSAASALRRNQRFVQSFQELVVCMDNDEAGDKGVETIRGIYPDIKIARIPKTMTKDGKKQIKDANDLVMDGRSQELFNALRYNAAKESPAAAVSVMDCMEEALAKPEWGIPYPWKGLTDMTYGLIHGELIAVGGGVGSGKTLLAHEICSDLITNHGESAGVFMLEETAGATIKNIAGKSANTPFHLPDAEFDPELLRSEAMKYQGKLHLYKNFGQNDWEDIKQCIRFWVIEHGTKFIFLDNITCLVSHLTPSEINTEVARIASELAGMCNELNFTCFVFSHLNPPSGGPSHEDGGQVREVQFTGSRALMRFSQLIIGFERNKQGKDGDKNMSIIRLLKDRKFGRSGEIYTKYNPATGRLTERSPDEVNKEAPFTVYDAASMGGQSPDEQAAY